MGINDRIKEVRKEKKLSQEAFGEKLGMSRSMVVNLEMDKLKNVDQVKRYCKAISNIFEVNETWLLTGEGSMHDPTTRKQELAQITADLYNADPDGTMYKFMKELSKLRPETWKDIGNFINKVSRSDEPE